MRNRSLIVSVLALFVLLLVASSAYAGAPPTATVVIRSVTFENSANASDTLAVSTTFDPNNTYLLNPPTWGAHVYAKHLGAKGFWCAGSQPTSGTSYPAGTRGQAVLWLPECYESNLSFWYKEPSFGAADSPSPFTVNWSSGGPSDSVAPNGYSEQLPIAPVFAPISRTRGAGGTNPPLSAGWLRFQFASHTEQTSTGYGPSIDDILVTGFLFGPVNNLDAKRQAGDMSSVRVSWAKPYQYGTSTPDSRTVYYRVWRLDVAANQWTELTSAGAISDTSYLDSGSADIGKRYQYAVQAYESPSNTTQYGKLATYVSVEKAIPHFLGITGSGLTFVDYHGGVTHVSAALVDEVGASMASRTADVVVERWIGGVPSELPSSTATIVEGPGGTYSASVTSTVNSYYRLKYGPSPLGSSPLIAVVVTGYVSTPVTPTKVTVNKYFTVKGSANRVPTAGRYVILRAYHKETKTVSGKKKTVWVLRNSGKALLGAGNGVGAYSVKFKVTRKGSWRMYAVLADNYNPGRTSGVRSFSTK